MLPYTGEQQQDLADRLDEAVRQLREATPAWWQTDGAKLATVADVEAAERGLTGDEADQVRAAAEDFRERRGGGGHRREPDRGKTPPPAGRSARRLAPAATDQRPDAEPVSLRAHAAGTA